jgi:hypothetical protein
MIGNHTSFPMFKKSNQNLKSENPQDNAEKSYVHEFGFMAEKEKEEKRARGNLEMKSCGLDTEFVPFAIREKLVCPCGWQPVNNS